MDPINKKPSEKLVEEVGEPSPHGNAQDKQAQDLASGEMIGDRYKVLCTLGRGAMGTVYECEQTFLKKKCAVKVLHGTVSEQATRRFQKEGQATSKLDHPNIVKAYDAGALANGQPFMAMELVEGKTLSETLKQTGRLSAADAIATFIPLCFALDYAHKEGIIHRDLKPGNIVLVEGEPGQPAVAKIVDFGIARLEDEAQTLTQTGEIFGTPLYMSPEQCAGTRVDQRSDIYSLGCVLFEALTGLPPFRGATALETMMQHSSALVPSMKETSLGQDVDPALEAVVRKMLAKHAADRYQTCGEVAQELIKITQGKGNKVASQAQPAPAESAVATHMILMAIIAALGLAATMLYAATTNRPPSADSTEQPKPAQHAEDISSLGRIVSGVIASKVEGNERVFTAPNQLGLGQFGWWDHGAYHNKEIWGQVRVPRDARLMVFAGMDMIGSSGNFLAQFGEGDIRGLYAPLQFNSPSEQATLVNTAAGINQLNLLVLRKGTLDRNSYVKLGLLPNLRWLELYVMKNGEYITAMENLPKLKFLKTANTGAPTAILTKLLQSSSLHRLSMQKERLTPEDFALIGQLHSVSILDVTDNDITNQRDKVFLSQCLKPLANMPNLEGLALDLKYVNDPCFEVIKQMKHLKVLAIGANESMMSEQQKQLLQSLKGVECKTGQAGLNQHAEWFDPSRGDPAAAETWVP